MHRNLYVLVYPSRLFAAHWSFWIPYADPSGKETNIGDRINATGDRLHGFKYEYLRDYNVNEDDRKPSPFPIGLVSASTLEMLSEDETGVFNDLDKACREVSVPGPSLNNVKDPVNNAGPPKKMTVKDCQWWIKQIVPHLMDSNLLIPLKDEESQDPITLTKNLPKH